jgi:C-terminal processing protease CtpA/Prc
MDSRDPALDSVTHAEIVANLREKLRSLYVFPDVAEQVCARLDKGLQSGRYASIADGNRLAQALTEDLQYANSDEHLWIRYVEEPLPEAKGSLLQNEERVKAFRQRAVLDNYGIHKVERLRGNVGYIDIHHFCRPSWGSGDTAVAAMTFLANTHALIVDLRQCGGGNPGMVALISTYLFDGEPILLNSLYWRDGDRTQQYWTLPHVSGKRYGDKPVYVLISHTTFSAGEEFAYNLQTRQRATLIGETTAGGAHPGSPHRVHAHFEAFIPSGRAINPITGTDWEGVGVEPDVAVSQEEALGVAYRMALESVVETIGEAAHGPLKALREEAREALLDSH